MTTKFRVPDATCGHCKQTIETAVSGIDGVTAADLELRSKILTVEHSETVGADVLVGAVSAAGYSPERS